VKTISIGGFISAFLFSIVLYTDAKNGKIKFAAVNKNPDSLVTCSIRVELQNDATKKGDTAIVVVEQTLKIVMDTPYVVRPVIPPTTVNAPTRENQKEFTIRLTRGGLPVTNYPFQLTTNYIDSSGGHHHITPRREVSRGNYGHFILRRTNTHVDRPYNGTTQANGQERFYYISSVFGDTMLISIRSTNSIKEKFFKDSVMVVERVRDLFELGAGTTYELVGNPDNHSGTNDPCRPVAPTSVHYDNHYGTRALLGAVQNIAASYDSLHPGIWLRINDMSLEYGGLFDVNNNWRTPHGEHRVGKNADIGFTGLNTNNRCVNLNLMQLLTRIRAFTSGPTLRENDHYHIRVN
jgi:hypothetical protein